MKDEKWFQTNYRMFTNYFLTAFRNIYRHKIFSIIVVLGLTIGKSYEQLYKDEQRLSRLFLYLAILAIFIASIGLLGLSSFLAEQRIKEIGIRKATGDTTKGIILMFTREFIKWVLISGLIAIPIAWYSMNSWLNGFAYHVSVDIWIFAASCLIAMIITISTTIIQTYRIASRNPVEALRYE